MTCRYATMADWFARTTQRGATHGGVMALGTLVARSMLPALLAVTLVWPPLGGAEADLEEQMRLIAAQLCCPVCHNLSVADSPSELVQKMGA